MISVVPTGIYDAKCYTLRPLRYELKEQVKNLTELWRFRGYVASSVGREFKLRYKGSIFGIALVLLVPVFQISLYVLVFGHLMQSKLPGAGSLYGYSIYLCTGVIFWNFFSELLQKTQGLFIDNANLLKKSAFPRAILPAVNFFSSSLNLALALIVFFAFLVVSREIPGPSLLWLLLVWLQLALVALSCGLLIGMLQVFFRDFATLTGLGLQALFWTTPIVYPKAILPPFLLPWLDFNPLLAPINLAQAVMLGSDGPPLRAWLVSLFFVGTMSTLAWRFYKKNSSDLLDNL